MPKSPGFLADLNISPLTIARLRQAGWDIRRTSDCLPAHAADEEILSFARQAGWTILTQDLDFSALLAIRGLDRPSLVTLRLLNPDPLEVERKLLESSALLERALELPCAVTIDDRGVRVRLLPMR